MDYRCLDCDVTLLDEEIVWSTLDAYAQTAAEMDMFCPHCGGDNIQNCTDLEPDL